MNGMKKAAKQNDWVTEGGAEGRPWRLFVWNRAGSPRLKRDEMDFFFNATLPP